MTDERIWRLDLDVDECDREPSTALLFELAPFGWEELEPAPGRVLFRLHFEDPGRAGEVAQAMQARFPGAHADQASTPRRNWALAWREFFTAVPCGEDFLVIPPWMVAERPCPERVAIVIEPKTAFGTGHHDTTAFCLQALSELFHSGRAAAGMRFLDLGTGSGILAIGCAKLGLSGIGLDIDPLAVENALENREINGVARAVQVAEGGVEALDRLAGDERFDVILANILAEPLMELAPALAKRLKPGGCLVLSGLLRIQAPAVSKAYTDLGFPSPRAIEGGEWAALIWD